MPDGYNKDSSNEERYDDPEVHLELHREARKALLERDAPENYVWVNQSLNILLCTSCGACVFNGVGAGNYVLTHNLWHAQIRQMYKAIQLGGLNENRDSSPSGK